MKKIIFLFTLLFSTAALMAQNLDTVLVRNLAMQAQDWAWFAGKNADRKDSLTIITIRRIRARVQPPNTPATWQTSVTVDSIPGVVAIKMYEQLVSESVGVIGARYTSIRNAFVSKTNLTYFIGFVDAAKALAFERERDYGRQILLDQ